MYSKGMREAIQIVKIDLVDMDKREIHCTSRDGGRFTIKLPVGNGVYRVPRSGEDWVVRRENVNSWTFRGIVEGDNNFASVIPLEGDIVIETPSELKISANGVYINNSALGVWEYEQFAIEGSTTTEITLADSPVSSVIQVFNNGLLIPPSGIIIIEQTLLFTNALNAGIAVVYYMRLPDQ